MRACLYLLPLLSAAGELPSLAVFRTNLILKVKPVWHIVGLVYPDETGSDESI